MCYVYLGGNWFSIRYDMVVDSSVLIGKFDRISVLVWL